MDPRPEIRHPQVRDPELLQALGQLTVYYAMLEDELKFRIWVMMGNEEARSSLGETLSQQIAQVVLAGRPFIALIDMFCSLCQLHLGNSDRLENVRKKLDRIRVERNKYVHSQWAWGRQPGTFSRYRYTARSSDGLKFTDEEITVANVRDLADEIGAVAVDIAYVLGP